MGGREHHLCSTVQATSTCLFTMFHKLLPKFLLRSDHTKSKICERRLSDSDVRDQAKSNNERRRRRRHSSRSHRRAVDETQKNRKTIENSFVVKTEPKLKKNAQLKPKREKEHTKVKRTSSMPLVRKPKKNPIHPFSSPLATTTDKTIQYKKTMPIKVPARIPAFQIEEISPLSAYVHTSPTNWRKRVANTNPHQSQSIYQNRDELARQMSNPSIKSQHFVESERTPTSHLVTKTSSGQQVPVFTLPARSTTLMKRTTTADVNLSYGLLTPPTTTTSFSYESSRVASIPTQMNTNSSFIGPNCYKDITFGQTQQVSHNNYDIANNGTLVGKEQFREEAKINGPYYQNKHNQQSSHQCPPTHPSIARLKLEHMCSHSLTQPYLAAIGRLSATASMNSSDVATYSQHHLRMPSRLFKCSGKQVCLSF